MNIEPPVRLNQLIGILRAAPLFILLLLAGFSSAQSARTCSAALPGRFQTSFLLLFSRAVIQSGMAPSDAPEPSSQVTAKPGPRATHSLIYDEELRKIILLDGTWANIQPEFTEIWSWDGKNWELIPGSGPRARYASAAVYDSRRKRIVVYGGRVGKSEEIKSDTWEWDGKSWHEMARIGVDARDHHALAYDSARGKTVMFGGGVFPRRSGAWPTDTWEWDGVKWTQVATIGPVGRFTTMVYDSKRKQIVLFGGVGAPPQPQPNYNDTWVWDGRSWRKVISEGPPARDRHAMAFDSRAGIVLLYGGSTRAGQFGDMWQWDGHRWTEIKMTGPTPGKRDLHAMVYDAARDRTVLYSGNREGKVLDDIWEWDGKRWTQIK
jgi:hypothetical protein